MPALLEIIKKTTEFFASKGIESPRLNAELLIGHALGLPRMQLYIRFEQVLGEVELEKIRPLVRRRAQREPLQYILGEAEFSGMRLKVDKRALIPRPETELLVERVGAFLADRPPVRGLDLGTGSGAIALALARRFADSRWVAVDVSPEALVLAQENAATLGLPERIAYILSDWFTALPAGESFDVIVANPPYLSGHEVASAEPEVKNYEPAPALTPGDADGFSALRTIIAGARPWLSAGGLLAVETGIAQRVALEETTRAAGFTRWEIGTDLTGRERFLFAWN